jgi:hypothetical protein
MSDEVPPKQGVSAEQKIPKKIPIEDVSEGVQPKHDASQEHQAAVDTRNEEALPKQGASPEQETPTESVSEGIPSRQGQSPEQNQDELATIKRELAKWEEYCSQWARAYHSAAQRTLSMNGKLVGWGVFLAALTTVLSGAGGAASSYLQWLAVAGGAVGVATTTITGLQKLTFASPEQAKQYRSAAVAYESTKRDIQSALTLFVVADLRTQVEAVKTQLIATDAQAPELPAQYRPSY